MHRFTRRTRCSALKFLPLDALESRTLLSLGAALPVAEAPPAQQELYSSEHIIVRYRPDAIEAASGHDLAGALVPGMRTVPVREGSSVEEALAFARSDPRVLYAQPDYVVSITASPDDPRFGSLWGLNNTGQSVGGLPGADISALEAWSVTTGSPDVIVAVIDTGIDLTHADLVPNLWVNSGEVGSNGQDSDGNGYIDDLHGWNFVNDSPNVQDDHNHGTHVSGTIGAVGNNALGVVGVNWNVKLMPLKFLDSSGRGYTSNAIKALNYAVEMGAHVSNHSYGGGGYSTAFVDAIAEARARGHIVVTAAGNNGSNNDLNPTYPANYEGDNLISVAATNAYDQIAGFSNYGVNTVHLGAPGVSILSSVRHGSYGYMSGTSMAAPHVTGAVALIRGLHPDWSYDQVIAKVLATVDPLSELDGVVITGGRLNLGRAVTSETNGPQIESAMALAGAENRIRLRFSEAIRPDSFTIEDVLSLTGPEGQGVSIGSVSVVPGSADREFDVVFSSAGVGTYQIVVGPKILDLAGNFVDQDRDGLNGTVPSDQFEASVTVTAPPTATVQILDDTQSGYAEVGYWRYSVLGGFDQTSRYAAAGDGAATATWSFAVTPGASYRVSATWSASPNRASNAPFRLLDDGQVQETILVDQRQTPGAFTEQGAGWEDLGVVTVSSGVLQVQLSNRADGFVIADAIRIEEVPAPPPPLVQVLDDTQSGYAEVGYWRYSVLGGFDQTSRYAGAGDGSATATWSFAVTPGVSYRVSATWSASPNRASNAPFRLLDDGQVQRTILVDQRQTPGAFTEQGTGWADLGVVTVSSGVLQVQLSNRADGFVIADAIRIEEVPAPSSWSSSLIELALFDENLSKASRRSPVLTGVDGSLLDELAQDFLRG
ncbi:S8 family serine peptidase [Tautonia marina]|uniref:S8 family serine peptidase n=1 Tax=Tautonia marina TaxID=2653855 RepID=UPI00126099E7|nr:S8 family serine peptidase [Tautonia marina]